MESQWDGTRYPRKANQELKDAEAAVAEIDAMPEEEPIGEAEAAWAGLEKFPWGPRRVWK